MALLFLLETWGLDAFSWFGQGKLGNRLISSMASIGLTLLAALAAWEAANASIQRHLERPLARCAGGAQRPRAHPAAHAAHRADDRHLHGRRPSSC